MIQLKQEFQYRKIRNQLLKQTYMKQDQPKSEKLEQGR